MKRYLNTFLQDEIIIFLIELILVIMFLISSSLCLANVGENASNLLNLEYGSVIMGLSSNAGCYTKNIEAARINPAISALIKDKSISFTYNSFNNSVIANQLNISFVKEKNYNIGLLLTELDYGNIDGYEINSSNLPENKSNFNPEEKLIILNAAVKFLNNLYLGSNIKYYNLDYTKYSTDRFIADFGLLLKNKNFNFGLSVINAIKNQKNDASLSKIKIISSINFNVYNTDIYLQVNKQEKEKLIYGMAIEKQINYLTLRTGFSDLEAINNNFSFGFSINFSKIDLDFALKNKNDLGTYQSFSINYKF